MTSKKFEEGKVTNRAGKVRVLLHWLMVLVSRVIDPVP